MVNGKSQYNSMQFSILYDEMVQLLLKVECCILGDQKEDITKEKILLYLLVITIQ